MDTPSPVAPAGSPGPDLRSSDEWPAGRVLVQAATFNERENVAALIERVLAVSPDLQFLVIDDDSPDGTADIVLAAAERNPRVHLLGRRGRRGLGSAILEGFQVARAHGFEVAVNMDADFSHDPDDIPRLLNALEPAGYQPADVAIGSRRVPGGRTEGWPWSRHVASRLVCWFTRWLLCVPVRDASSGFRAVRLAVLDRIRIDHDQFTPESFAFFEFLLWAVHRSGGKVVEVPICFTERVRGTSKVNVAAMMQSSGELLWLARRTWLY